MNNTKDYMRDWRAKNKDKIPKYKKDESGKTKVKYLEVERNRKYKWRYGITIDQYNEMLLRQNGVCFICGRANPKGNLSVDHNHSTGKIRRLLCKKCNTGLGNFDENVITMERAIQYLKDHS